MKFLIAINLFFCLLAIGQEQKYSFELTYGRGRTFDFNTPQKLTDKSKPQLYARHLSENNIRFKAILPKSILNRIGISFGVNYSEVNYMQLIFYSDADPGFGGYNYISDRFEFSRNSLTGFIGLTGNLSFYHDAILLSGGIHLAHSRFVNSNRTLGASDYSTWTSNMVNKFSYRYSMQIKNKNAPVILDLDIALKFRLSPSLYLNFGLNYVGGRKMEYDYFYEFKSYTASTDTWTEPQTHVNFNHLEQPRRIDHVFYLSSGITYTPQFIKRKKE